MQVCHLTFLKMGTKLEDWRAVGQDLHSTDLQAAAPPPSSLLPPWLRLAMLGSERKKVSHIMDMDTQLKWH